MNKRLLVLIPLFFFLFVQIPRVAQAANLPKPFIADIQQMINTALSPLQNSINGLTNRVSNLEATVTPIPGQIANIQATLTPIPGQINALQNASGKALRVLDANGNELGIYMSDNTGNITTFFIPSVNRRLTIAGDHPLDRWALLYNSTDCSGTPYIYATNNPDNHLNDIYSIGPNVYYEIKDHATPLNALYVHSSYRFNSNTNQFECVGGYQQISDGAYEVQEVTLPFSEPIATPLQFRYQ
jgi:hypothetical protein